MAITVVGFGQGFLAAMKAGVDFDAATYQLSLHTSTFAPNVDTMDFQSTLTNEVANGSGYTTGGVVLSGLAMTYDSASDQVRWDFNDPSWTFSASVSWRYGVGWINTAGAATTDPLMFLLDWGTTQTVSGVYTVTLDPTGLYAIDFT
jgi:hypothetical protein